MRYLLALLFLAPPAFAANCQPDLLSRVASRAALVWERAFGYKRDFSWTNAMEPAAAIKALLPMARGAEIDNPLDIYQANIKIRELAKRLPPDRSVLAVRILGGGWNESYLIEFEGGRKGVFKPFLGQKNLGPDRAKWQERVAFTRETTAVPLIEDYLGNRAAREAGLSRVRIPDTKEMILVFGGRSYGLGSVQDFVEGFETTTKFRTREVWSNIMTSREWGELEARVRTLDYILGNPDRFKNTGLTIPHYAAANLDNLMLPAKMRSPTELEGVLIDTAFGRPGLAEFDLRYVPAAREIPYDLRRAITSFDEEKFRMEFGGRLPRSGIEDTIKRLRALRGHIFRNGSSFF